MKRACLTCGQPSNQAPAQAKAQAHATPTET
jgi:hypothetical protein